MTVADDMSSAAVTEKSEIKALRLHGTVFLPNDVGGEKGSTAPGIMISGCTHVEQLAYCRLFIPAQRPS